MANLTLGRLEPVDLREVWSSEAGDFTPWLGTPENIKLLGDAIDLELAVEAQEHEVGPYRADILCKETRSDQWVLIENQLERTDHTHLGQLMTYAAGLKAVTIVWVAKQFSEEHRAALDWLNEITSEEFRFFGLEVEAWRIGDSAPAPKFNVVSKPNEWSRAIIGKAERAAGQLTPSKQLHLEFWTAFVAYAGAHAKAIDPQKPVPRNWLGVARFGRSGFGLYAIASFYDSENETFDNHEIRADFTIQHPRSDDYFAQLERQRADIERETGEPLEWHSAEGVRQRTIYVRRDANLNERGAWPEYFAWLTSKLDRLYEVFLPRVKALD